MQMVGSNKSDVTPELLNQGIILMHTISSLLLLPHFNLNRIRIQPFALPDNKIP